MNHIFQVDRNLPIPLYQQLADSIRAAIKKGLLCDGQQLPTVQELDLARGTIIRAYDILEREGLLEKIQGRGTFVRCTPMNELSRKERAMAAIDTLLDELNGMGFSAAEVNIFLNLKLRERSEEEAKVKIALVECNPENLSQMAKQLQTIPHVELYSYLMSSIAQYPYKLGEDMDIILTTQSHAEELTRLLPMKKRVTTVALGLTTESMVPIIKLEPQDNVGILCQSVRYGELLQRTCRLYAEETNVHPPLLVSQSEAAPEYLQDKQILLIPDDLETHCSRELLELLHHFPGQIIRCCYELDRGSFLYLQEKSKRVLKSKSL